MGQHCKSKRRRRRRVHVEEGSAEEEGNACGAGKVVLHEIQNYFLCMWRRECSSTFPMCVDEGE